MKILFHNQSGFDQRKKNLQSIRNVGCRIRQSNHTFVMPKLTQCPAAPSHFLSGRKPPNRSSLPLLLHNKISSAASCRSFSSQKRTPLKQQIQQVRLTCASKFSKGGFSQSRESSQPSSHRRQPTRRSPSSPPRSILNEGEYQVIRKPFSIPPEIHTPDYFRNKTGLPEKTLEDAMLRGASPIMHPQQTISEMRTIGKIAQEVLAFAGTLVRPGTTPHDIDELVHAEILRRRVFPSPLGYHGFPKSICTSVNNVMAHGIPDMRPLRNGDIISIDITLYSASGFHGDTCRTFMVGECDPQVSHLVETAKLALEAGISVVRDGQRFNKIGEAIFQTARSQNFFVVKDLVGHGIHDVFHTVPLIQHTPVKEDLGFMREGMIFTIEPILTENATEIETWGDEWTLVSEDNSYSAQFEHTVLVTKEGAEVLTLY